jgi:hypothetical protein
MHEAGLTGPEAAHWAMRPPGQERVGWVVLCGQGLGLAAVVEVVEVLRDRAVWMPFGLIVGDASVAAAVPPGDRVLVAIEVVTGGTDVAVNIVGELGHAFGSRMCDGEWTRRMLRGVDRAGGVPGSGDLYDGPAVTRGLPAEWPVAVAEILGAPPTAAVVAMAIEALYETVLVSTVEGV